MSHKNLGRGLKLALVGLFVCLFVSGPVLRSVAIQRPSPDAPVERTRKNIQVLKGLPEGQLFPLMNFVSASMGVRCDYCHVQQGKNAEGLTNWVWESDDKPQKRAARRMMQMTMRLNEANLADFRNQRVTCFTCHRGSTDPARLPPLPLARSGHEPGPAGSGVRPAAPAPEEVLARYVAAVGGREAISKLRTLILRGTREATQGRNWPFQVTFKAPDRILTITTFPAQGQEPQSEHRQAVAHGRGWIRNQRGEVREVSAAELADLRAGARLLAPIKIEEPFPKMTSGGLERVGDRDAYVLIGSPSPGVTVRYFFDRETGLLVRRLSLRETVLNPIPEQIDFEDYREVGGVKLPFTIRTSNIDTYYSSTRKFTEIRANVPVDDALFQMPKP